MSHGRTERQEERAHAPRSFGHRRVQARPLRIGREGGSTVALRAGRDRNLLTHDDCRPNRIAVLVTQAAREKHWAALAAELGELGYDERTGTLVAHDIPDGKGERQLWRVFEVVGQAIDGAEQVVFDTTHAFRSLQLVTLLALTFYRNARKIALERVL